MSEASGGRPSLAVVGATGAVGTVMLDLLSTREDVWGEIRLIASARSAGRRLTVRGRETEVVALSEDAFDGIDVAMFDVPDEVSAQWAPSRPPAAPWPSTTRAPSGWTPRSRWWCRRSTRSTLAIRPKGIVSNPNCTTLSLIVAVGALHRAFGLEEMVVASYQAASGAGEAGIDTLYAQLDKVAGTRLLGQRTGDVRAAIGDLGPFPAPLAMNVVPWAGSLKADGWSSEELKIRNESRKILGLPELKISATCVRVPVVTTHSVAVHATFAQPVSREEAWRVLRMAPGRGGGRQPGRVRVPHPGRRGRHRPVLGRPDTPVARRPADHRAVRLRRQPAQGRGAEHGADRRAGGGGAWVAWVAWVAPVGFGGPSGWTGSGPGGAFRRRHRPARAGFPRLARSWPGNPRGAAVARSVRRVRPGRGARRRAAAARRSR